MTNTVLKAQIDSQITNEILPSTISPIDVGGNLKSVVDYIDQQVPIKTGTSTTLSLTPIVTPSDFNSFDFGGGIAYLPSTTIIGKEIYVIATANNIEIRANVANTAKMFATFNTFIASVTLTLFQMYRFTYIGFGSGTGGTTDGYWKAELI